MKFFKKLFQKHVIINIPGPLISVVPENCYATSVKCGNCGENLSLFIKKGIYIKYVIASVRCTHCGCKIDREVK